MKTLKEEMVNLQFDLFWATDQFDLAADCQSGFFLLGHLVQFKMEMLMIRLKLSDSASCNCGSLISLVLFGMVEYSFSTVPCLV